jgi:hypothetical protein
MGVFYATREDVKAALDIRETARNNKEVDSAIDSASRTVEGALNRVFYPTNATRYFDWPNFQYARSWRLYLEQHELVSVSLLTSGGVTISSSDYYLEPINDGPPYTRIELRLDHSESFGKGTTHQRDVAVTGVFCGCALYDLPSGTLGEALDNSETGVDVSDSAAIGVGSIIKVESERMLVTEKTMKDTGVNIDAGDSLTASMADVSITASTLTGIPIVGETILIDSERMLVVDVAGLIITVKRASDGSVLATHAGGADIYAPRTLTVSRAALGTSAATHADTTAITRHEVPALITEFTVALALNTLLQRSSGYARVSGQGDNAQEFTGRGIAAIQDDAMTAYGRLARISAI